MRFRAIAFAAVACLLATASALAKDPPEPSAPPKIVDFGKGGWLIQRFDYWSYAVDPATQMCFVSCDGSVSPIPCANLKKRPEWKDIITWD